MGVTDLFKVVFPGQRKKQQVLGAVLGGGRGNVLVDFSDWLHQALYGAAVEMAEGNRAASKNRVATWFKKRLGTFRASSFRPGVWPLRRP